MPNSKHDKPRRRLSRVPIALLLGLGLPSVVTGCATSNIATDAATIASAIGKIEPSRRDTCETQRQIAEQSSRIDTIVEGKEVVYRADCKPGAKIKPQASQVSS